MVLVIWVCVGEMRFGLTEYSQAWGILPSTASGSGDQRIDLGAGFLNIVPKNSLTEILPPISEILGFAYAKI